MLEGGAACGGGGESLALGLLCHKFVSAVEAIEGVKFRETVTKKC